MCEHPIILAPCNGFSPLHVFLRSNNKAGISTTHNILVTQLHSNTIPFSTISISLRPTLASLKLEIQKSLNPVAVTYDMVTSRALVSMLTCCGLDLGLISSSSELLSDKLAVDIMI